MKVFGITFYFSTSPILNLEYMIVCRVSGSRFTVGFLFQSTSGATVGKLHLFWRWRVSRDSQMQGQINTYKVFGKVIRGTVNLKGKLAVSLQKVTMWCRETFDWFVIVVSTTCFFWITTVIIKVIGKIWRNFNWKLFVWTFVLKYWVSKCILLGFQLSRYIFLSNI